MLRFLILGISLISVAGMAILSYKIFQNKFNKTHLDESENQTHVITLEIPSQIEISNIGFSVFNKNAITNGSASLSTQLMCKCRRNVEYGEYAGEESKSVIDNKPVFCNQPTLDTVKMLIRDIVLMQISGIMHNKTKHYNKYYTYNIKNLETIINNELSSADKSINCIIAGTKIQIYAQPKVYDK